MHADTVTYQLRIAACNESPDIKTSKPRVERRGVKAAAYVESISGFTMSSGRWCWCIRVLAGRHAGPDRGVYK